MIRSELGDFNMLIDKLHTVTNSKIISRMLGWKKLKTIVINSRRKTQKKHNNSTASFYHDNSIFLDLIIRKIQATKEIEKLIDQERAKADSQVNELESDKRELYFDIKKANAEYIKEIEKKQAELDELTKKTSILEQALASDPVKKKSLLLIQKLNDLTAKKRDYQEALQSANGPMEKEKLLSQVIFY